MVYSRANCPLCDDFIAALIRELAPSPERFDIRDVDADPVARRRFALKIPVLTVDGSLVCHGQLDTAAVARLLAR